MSQVLQAIIAGADNPFVALGVLLPVLFLVFKFFKTSHPPLPPGPYQWPLVGNALQIGKKPHMSLANFAKTHGPIISLRLGTQRLIVGSTMEAATEILKTHDRVLSGRYLPHVLPSRDAPNNRSIGFTPECDAGWKYLRTLCRTELFSEKALQSQTSVREKKVREMVKYIRSMEGKAVNVSDVIFATVFNTVSNLLVSRDILGLDDENTRNDIRMSFELTGATNISDLFPVLGGLDLQGIRKDFIKQSMKLGGLYAPAIKDRRERKETRIPSERDFLDVLIENDFSNNDLHQLLRFLFLAGTDTTSSTTEWAMAELIKNKESMTGVREELAKVVNEDAVKESQLAALPLLQACVKETLRLHPAAPLLLPHRATETCQVMNYTIPKGSRIAVNVWAIGRDPERWGDPLTFKPERFIDSKRDFKGNDFEFLPFGAGRRICPGIPLAVKQIPLILASLINYFDWSLPEGMDPSGLDMNEKPGVTLQKEQPLLLIPKARAV